MMQWLVVFTQLHAEQRAEFHLDRQGYDVYLPTYTRERRHARKTERVVRPVFPRYLFVACEPASTPWRAIQSTIGVSGLVLNGERPVMAPQWVIDEIREREGEDGYVRLCDRTTFAKGQAVRIVDGPLSDRTALFQSIDDKERAVILMDLLGRQVKTQLPIETLNAIH